MKNETKHQNQTAGYGKAQFTMVTSAEKSPVAPVSAERRQSYPFTTAAAPRPKLLRKDSAGVGGSWTLRTCRLGRAPGARCWSQPVWAFPRQIVRGLYSGSFFSLSFSCSVSCLAMTREWEYPIITCRDSSSLASLTALAVLAFQPPGWCWGASSCLIVDLQE